MITLGINAAFHDCAAALVRDGVVLAAAEDERFTHVKHGKRPVPFTTWQLPFHAIDYCLEAAGVTLAEVDHVAYSFDPALLDADLAGADSISLPMQPSAQRHDGALWEPLFISYIVNASRQLAGGAPHHLQRRFAGVTHEQIAARWHYVEHHLCHEASAFLASPFDSAAVLTMDGRGERATTSYGMFENGIYQRICQVDVPHSLGLLYEDLTRYLGFLHSSDEYKVMALASYGRPAYVKFFEDLIDLGEDGAYRIAKPDFAAAFGAPRGRGAPFEQRHFDIASSLQHVLEETALKMARWLHRQTGADFLCMAGGVALNCVMNARLRDRGPFSDVWVQPAAGDAGTALGAALWIDSQQRTDNGDPPARAWRMDHAYLGPEFSDVEIEDFLRWTQVPYRKSDDIARDTAELLAAEKVVGWFQGRMEFGPRALGARSILASPLHAEMQGRLNEIKDREDFRPVAPVVLEERAHEWFMRGDPGRKWASYAAPFMLFIFDVPEDKAARIPAVRHVDGTARVQTVNRAQHPLYYDLLRNFEARTGVPVLVNTSFNTRGEPIVCTPRDAVECFWTSPLDALAIGSFLLEKPRSAQS
ncbi:MAG: carbamoyltransferase [Bradyrhizobium sp.]|nr:carbamoyltransferase [Bradyrhizobium sp.]